MSLAKNVLGFTGGFLALVGLAIGAAKELNGPVALLLICIAICVAVGVKQGLDENRRRQR